MSQQTTQVCIDNVEQLLREHKSFESIKTVLEESGVQVRVVSNSDDGQLENLFLLVADKNATILSPLQMECNGLIFEKDTNNIVCMAQNKFTDIDDDEIQDLLLVNSIHRTEYCEDGTVIRLYHYRGKWFTATTRCIDARKSHWSSDKTFDEMFWEIFNNPENNTPDLDPSYTYSFIIVHKENRIVVQHKHNNLIYVNRVHNTTKAEDFTNYFHHNSCIKHTRLIHLQHTHSLERYYLPDKRGIVIKVYHSHSNSWKLYNYNFKKYSEIKDIRGNVPFIRTRYLELLNDPEKLVLLTTNYPENAMVFAMIEHCLTNLYKEVHNLYFQSHVKHTITINEDHRLYRTLRQLHGIYRKTKTVITLDEVQKKIDSLSPNIIKTLIGWEF